MSLNRARSLASALHHVISLSVRLLVQRGCLLRYSRQFGGDTQPFAHGATDIKRERNVTCMEPLILTR